MPKTSQIEMEMKSLTCSMTLFPNIPANSDIHEETQTFMVGGGARNFLDQPTLQRKRWITKGVGDFP